jgi:hypothetical protein
LVLLVSIALLVSQLSWQAKMLDPVQRTSLEGGAGGMFRVPEVAGHHEPWLLLVERGGTSFYLNHGCPWPSLSGYDCFYRSGWTCDSLRGVEMPVSQKLVEAAWARLRACEPWASTLPCEGCDIRTVFSFALSFFCEFLKVC